MREIRWLLLLLLPALLVACGDDGGGAAEGAAAECEEGETDGDLVLYNWSDYMDPELLEAFSDEHGVEVTEDFYPSNEEMLARVQEGASGYDVVVPSDYMVAIMAEEELLLELSDEAIPNAENLSDEFTSPPYDPDLTYSKPYQWGTTGLGVDVGELGEGFPRSWALVFDPEVADQHSGRISLLDDPRETMAGALFYLGHEPNTTNEDELQEASDLIAETTDRLAAFESEDYTGLLLGGETVISHGYSGTFFDGFFESDDPENWDYVIPEEGGIIWTDNMAVLADAPHPCTAHTFINFMLDAENGAQLSNWTYYATPNEAALEFVDAEALEDPAIYPDEELRERLEFLEDTGETEIRYNDLFNEAKS